MKIIENNGPKTKVVTTTAEENLTQPSRIITLACLSFFPLIYVLGKLLTDYFSL